MNHTAGQILKVYQHSAAPRRRLVHNALSSLREQNRAHIREIDRLVGCFEPRFAQAETNEIRVARRVTLSLLCAINRGERVY